MKIYIGQSIENLFRVLIFKKNQFKVHIFINLIQFGFSNGNLSKSALFFRRFEKKQN